MTPRSEPTAPLDHGARRRRSGSSDGEVDSSGSARTPGRAQALLITSRPALGRALRQPLQDARFDLLATTSGLAGLQTFYSERPDVVVLELDLADLEGTEVLALIKDRSVVPVLAVAGRGARGRIAGLRAGADDCVSKPIEPEEIVLRVESLRRRSGFLFEPEVIAEGLVRFDQTRRGVLVRGVEIGLTATEFRMLEALAANRALALGEEQLRSLVWGERSERKHAVATYVSLLRRKLAVAGVDPVETVRGVGYRYGPRIIDGGDTGSADSGVESH